MVAKKWVKKVDGGWRKVLLLLFTSDYQKMWGYCGAEWIK